MATAVLLLSCPDRSGIVHAVAEFVLTVGGNILHAEQHVDHEVGIFFQRVEFDFDEDRTSRAQLRVTFGQVERRFGMDVSLRFADERPRIALLASRQAHCLADLLGRWRSGELPAEVVIVVSNHEEHAALADFSRVPFSHMPITPENRSDQERRLVGLLRGHEVETVVLARYMQVLGEAALGAYPSRIINIHHSFLPAFVGAKPYQQAQQRGVKLIGATAHYATAELDEGPIIAQDVVAVSHRDSVADLVRKGRDLETVVLARAVRAHVEHRTLVFGNKTIVFG
ncbi:MAG: formyltetrahydrofolate deformylase [Actinomycetota bacterium]|nr:formyltetrahydrofolate deformylase [Actinomycetota bacterium]